MQVYALTIIDSDLDFYLSKHFPFFKCLPFVKYLEKSLKY
jgi:hypothetical protein